MTEHGSTLEMTDNGQFDEKVQDGSPAVEVSSLRVDIDASGAPIISDIDLTVHRGEILGVVGESGSGKSTLALALLAYARRGARIAGGSVRVGDLEMLALTPADVRAARRSRIAFVPQDPATALNPRLSLRTQLTEGLEGDDVIDRIKRILRQVGLPDDDAFLRRKPRALSGGQQQRVAIAMAAAAEPDLIVFDEPTTGLDVTVQARVLDLVRQLCVEKAIAVLYVTHDLAVVAHIAQRIIVMFEGGIVEQGPTMRVITAPRHPYTRALITAAPSVRVRRRLVPIDRAALASVAEIEARDGEDPEAAVALQTRQEPAPVLPPREDAAESVFEARNLQARYGTVPVLHDISLTVGRGRCVAVVGESGSGKTTLSRCLIGLHEQQTGELEFAGAPIPHSASQRDRATRQQIQYVFQNPYNSLNPRRTIGGSLELPLRFFTGVSGRVARTQVAEALERVSLAPALADRYPSELSGGQRQRVAIARALVCQPTLMICDEVTSALDVSVQASIIELLRGLLDDGLAMLFVTHDLGVVRSIADSVVVLQRGRVVESGTASAVLDHSSDPYTQELMANTLELPA